MIRKALERMKHMKLSDTEADRINGSIACSDRQQLSGEGLPHDLPPGDARD